MGLEHAKTEVDRAFTGDLRGLAFENAFGGATSFLRRRYSKDLTGADLAVLGVPFDQAVTHRTGPRFGPRAIREASTLQTFDPPYWLGLRPFTELAVVDTGDLAFDYAKPSDFPATLTARCRESGQGRRHPDLGRRPLHHAPDPARLRRRPRPSLGRPVRRPFDLWADDDMERLDHGTFLYKAVKLGLVDPAASVQIGIRTGHARPPRDAHDRRPRRARGRP
jgi:agmatinase